MAGQVSKEERDLFVAALVAELPSKSHEMALLAAQLIKLGTRHGRYQEQRCNVGLTEREEAAEERLEAKIASLLKPYGMSALCQGDPRGHTVKIILPSGRSNSWGGEGWGVPGS